MATREEKLELVEELKKQIEDVKHELELKEEKIRSQKSGSLFRTGILCLLLALGLGLAAFFLL